MNTDIFLRISRLGSTPLQSSKLNLSKNMTTQSWASWYNSQAIHQIRFLKDNDTTEIRVRENPHSAIFYAVICFNVFQYFTRFFYKQRFFSAQPQCCLTFSWTELQMLLRCCLIHLIIIIWRYFLYLLYLCSFLDLGLYMSYLCSFAYFIKHVLLFLDDNVDEECE